jgi:quinol monooxygenase YgiN
MPTRRSSLLLLLCLSVIGVRAASAQAQPDPTVHAVAYFEVRPAARGTMEAALAAYRQASRTDAGFVGMDVLAQSDRAGLYTVVESWRDRAAFDAHAGAAHTMRLRAAFDAVRITGYDERFYKTLSVAPASAPDAAGVVYVVSHVDIGGQGTNAPGILSTLAEASRKEAGNLRFDVLQHAMRANHFTVVEVWRTMQARDAHAAAAHTKAYRDTLQPLTGSPLDERLFVPVK